MIFYETTQKTADKSGLRCRHSGRSRRAAAGAESKPDRCAELIYGDSNTRLTFPLEKDADYAVDTGYLTVHIRIQDGAARFVDSPCPDHICESFGWLSEEDQTATCLPARAVLSIIPTT